MLLASNLNATQNEFEYVPAVTLLGSFAILHPAGHRKIGRLSTIEAMIEASMVSKRKGNHYLFFLLCYLWKIAKKKNQMLVLKSKVKNINKEN